MLLLVGRAAAIEEIGNEVAQLLIVSLGNTEASDNEPALLGALGCSAAPGDVTALLLIANPGEDGAYDDETASLQVVGRSLELGILLIVALIDLTTRILDATIMIQAHNKKIDLAGLFRGLTDARP